MRVFIESQLLQEFIAAEDKSQAALFADFEQDSLLILLTNDAGDIEYVNPAFETLTQYKKSEVLSLNPRILKSGFHPQSFYDNLWKSISAGKTFKDVVINQKKDGSVYYEDVSIFPVKNRAGEITHYLAFGKDVTEQYNTQKELALFKMIVDNSGDAIMLTDGEGRFIFVNDKTQILTGYSEKQLLHMSIFDISLKYKTAKDANRLLMELRGVKKKTYDTKFKRADGTLVDIENSGIFFIHDEAEYNLFIARDITERIKTQEQLVQKVTELTQLHNTMEQKIKDGARELLQKELLYHAIFESSASGLCLIDKNGNFSDINSRFLKIIGYKNKKELVGRHFSTIISPSMKIRVLREFLKLSRDDKNHQYIVWPEVELIGKKGEPVQVFLTGNLSMFEGAASAIVSIVDISASKKEQQKRIEMEKLLMQQSKLAAMGEMIGAIAHQWRQPLTAVSSSVVNLGMKKSLGVLKDEDLDTAFTDIEQQTQKMSGIISDFLNFFKPTKEKREFTLNAVFESILAFLGTQLSNKDIKVNIDTKSHSIIGYKSELEQVFLNIIINSRDAFDESAQTDKRINIYVMEYEWKIDIVFEDNAGGIPEGIVERVFEPYFTTKDEGKGTGIGLYMSKMIIEKSFYGNIYAHNIYDKANNKRVGAQFIVELAKENLTKKMERKR